MKLQIGSLVLMFILLSASLAMPAAASVTVGVNAPTVKTDYSAFNYFGMKFTNVCYVSTAGGNLNVRNTRGAIIGKLPNGTKVTVIQDSDDSALVTARVGRKIVRGWVSYEYLDCD